MATLPGAIVPPADIYTKIEMETLGSVTPTIVKTPLTDATTWQTYYVMPKPGCIIHIEKPNNILVGINDNWFCGMLDGHCNVSLREGDKLRWLRVALTPSQAPLT